MKAHFAAPRLSDDIVVVKATVLRIEYLSLFYLH